MQRTRIPCGPSLMSRAQENKRHGRTRDARGSLTRMTSQLRVDPVQPSDNRIWSFPRILLAVVHPRLTVVLVWFTLDASCVASRQRRCVACDDVISMVRARVQ